MSKKTFKRNSSPIEIEIEDVKGEVHNLNSIVLFTPDQTEEIESILFEKDVSYSSKIVKQMIKIFGKDKAFYLNFELHILGDVLTFVSEELYSSKKKPASGLTK